MSISFCYYIMLKIMKNTCAVVLAAGKGVRMKSELPKVFNPILGKPMLEYVVNTLKELKVDQIFVVVGHKKEMIIEYFKNQEIVFVEQKEQLGTGHAVMQVEPYLKNYDGKVLVLAGDVPMLRAKTLSDLYDFHVEKHSSATVLTAELPDALNYGRIIRNQDGLILKIVEKKDASSGELLVREINTGTFCFEAKQMFYALSQVKAENAQKEYYLTDTIEILKERGYPVFAYQAKDYKETLGINTPEELKEIEKRLVNY
ncbi:MAG: glmU protein [Candidatus Saganbacteria bacterium]|uniref:GlmU protein n=1 Tax=Candidatus Saganbacteria bacterium TaxID=2575572 RepID=A0A833L4K5_UNCSA|nr:MAG: glmU protein [Candidatus Saganbacteria bacterium]